MSKPKARINPNGKAGTKREGYHACILNISNVLHARTGPSSRFSQLREIIRTSQMRK